mgnify:CR=1 FL=1
MKTSRTIGLVTSFIAAMLLLPGAVMADKHMTQRDWQERMMQERGMYGGMGYGGMGMMGGGMGYGGMGMMGGGMGYGGMGMMHGGMMGGGMPYMMASMLDLDDKQRNQMRELQRTQRKANWQRMGEMIDLQYELQGLYDQDKPDAKAVSKVYDKIHALRKQMIESQIETRNKMRDVLTKEQQEKFDSFRHGMGYGGMGMMGGGMGYGGMGMMPMMGGMDMME